MFYKRHLRLPTQFCKENLAPVILQQVRPLKDGDGFHQHPLLTGKFTGRYLFGIQQKKHGLLEAPKYGLLEYWFNHLGLQALLEIQRSMTSIIQTKRVSSHGPYPVFQAIETVMFIPFKKFCAIPFPSKITICNHHQKMLQTLKNMFSSGTASNLATYSSWHLGSSIILQNIPTL